MQHVHYRLPLVGHKELAVGDCDAAHVSSRAEMDHVQRHAVQRHHVQPGDVAGNKSRRRPEDRETANLLEHARTPTRRPETPHIAALLCPHGHTSVTLVRHVDAALVANRRLWKAKLSTAAALATKGSKPPQLWRRAEHHDAVVALVDDEELTARQAHPAHARELVRAASARATEPLQNITSRRGAKHVAVPPVERGVVPARVELLYARKDGAVRRRRQAGHDVRPGTQRHGEEVAAARCQRLDAAVPRVAHSNARRGRHYGGGGAELAIAGSVRAEARLEPAESPADTLVPCHAAGGAEGQSAPTEKVEPDEVGDDAEQFLAEEDGGGGGLSAHVHT
mmetsp:Transcript_27058/g.80805  ORF Transcript_27058/g.80805 Transcript_27058/m.80805 type:complete len:338 (+) Transcript_27058:75-1088(+)